MLASAAKQTKNKWKKKIKSMKETNFVLIPNDKILVIF